MSTVATTNIKHNASASNNIVLDNAGNAAFASNVTVAGNVTSTGMVVPSSSFLRNRIINGDMRIDQRNAGASVTPTNGQYIIDRWRVNVSQSSKFSTQQNAGAVTPPPGFTNYLGITSLSAYVVTGNDAFSFEQIIEGFNVSDLNWGTANALATTLSFWVRSSLTGTFGGSIATTRTAIWVMPFSFTISAANTWTYVTVPITPPTSTGGANTDNSAGIFVRFGLGGAGTSVGGTVGVWTNSGNFIQPAGTVSVVGTNGATFYLTGVQFEVGTAATPFERRQYGQELLLCQRYFQKTFDQAVAPAQNAGGNGGLTASGSVTNVSINASWWFACPMRAVPTIVTFAPDQASANWSDQGGARPTAAVTSTGQSSVGIRGQGSVLAGGYYIIQATASAEL